MYLCHMEVNKKLYTLDEVYSGLSHLQTIEVLEELRDYRTVWLVILDELREDSTDIVERVSKIMEIEEQLEYLEHNIRTFENAIMCHETKIFEKRNLLGGLVTFCLN
jgi:hypothetical protein